MLYQLLDPFDLATGGETHTITEIELKAPTSRDCRLLAIIDREYNKALRYSVDSARASNAEPDAETVEKARQAKESTSIEDQAEGIIQLMAIGGADFGECIDAMRKCICGRASFNDGIKVTDPYYNNVSYKDSKRLLGLFVVNFIDSSL